MPDEVTTLERIEVRVARILLEGSIVASPKAGGYTLVVSGSDSPEMRELIAGPRQLAHLANDPHVLSVGGRDLVVGPVYVIHPEAAPINTDDARTALQESELRDFRLKLKPGGDRYFNLALADRPVEELYDQRFFGWGLIGIEQPDVEYEVDEEPPEDTDGNDTRA
jgi:hypothetical protein